MAKPEDRLRDYLERSETNSDVTRGDDPGSDLLTLREQLRRAASSTPSMAGRVRGEQRMLTALADSRNATQPTGIRIPAFFGAVPKAAFATLGLLVLTGSAMTASAAAGGPNVPAALLAAVGIENLGPLSAAESGIGFSEASQTGLDHANENAEDGGAKNSEDKGDNRAT